MLPSVHLAALLCLTPQALAQAPVDLTSDQAEAVEETWQLGEILIVTADIYDDATAQARLIPGLLNATHWTTRESTIRREIWVDPGDAVGDSVTAEIERNLRRLGLFANVRVTLVETADPGVRDLRVITRDKLSLGGGANGSVVGDVTSGSAALSESNLFGRGDQVRVSFSENDLGEFRGAFRYRDRHVLGSWNTGQLDVGRTDDGDFIGLSLQRPFRYLADTFAWDARVLQAAQDRDYFSAGDNVAEVPFDQNTAGGSATWRDGTRWRFWTRGVNVNASDIEYGTARGPAAGAIRVPGDTTSLFAGGTLRYTVIEEFRKVQGLDTLKFIQDLSLGSSVRASVGGTFRDEVGGDQRVQPTFNVSADTQRAIGERRYVTAAVGANVRTVAGEAVGWNANASLRAFDLTHDRHTLSFAARYRVADETENLPVQLVLGEGNGLRGYAQREFTGQRIATLNFEDRIDLDGSLGVFDFGAVVFADVGWAAERQGGFGRPRRSAGVGLRIGSNALFGGGVLRLDLSFPFDELPGESSDPLISFALGQVFRFR